MDARGKPSPMNNNIVSRVECLDGLRGLAALWVLLGHCVILSGLSLPVIDKPDLGVDLFMMLSGFLMVFHYRLRAAREPWTEAGTWLKFWARRYFRIAPLYYLMLALALAAGSAILGWRAESDSFVHIPLQAPQSYLDTSLANIATHVTFLFGLMPAYVLRTPLPDWSLGLEMQFYAVFPALMLMTRRLGWTGSIILICLAAAIVTHATWHYSLHYALPSFLPLKIDIFLAGMLLAESCRQGRWTAGLYLLLALVLALQPFQGEGSLLRLAVREILVLTFFALVLHRFLPAPLGNGIGKVAAMLGKNPFRWMGDVSYSVYLLHLPILAPIIAFLVSHYGHGISASTRCAILFLTASAVVYPLSWLTYRFIEIPGQAAGRVFLRSLSGKSVDARTDRPESLAAP